MSCVRFIEYQLCFLGYVIRLNNILQVDYKIVIKINASISPPKSYNAGFGRRLHSSSCLKVKIKLVYKHRFCFWVVLLILLGRNKHNCLVSVSQLFLWLINNPCDICIASEQSSTMYTYQCSLKLNISSKPGGYSKMVKLCFVGSMYCI